MVTKALLARFESRDGGDESVHQFLLSAKPLVERETATTVWFALRFARGEFGIFDAFPDETGRLAHLGGGVASSLQAEAGALLEGPPRIESVDVIAQRLPPDDLLDVTRGLLLSFKAREGNEAAVVQFLKDARGLVEEETGTRAWFALQFDAQRFGIFDVFADTGARFAHLAGHVPRELAKHALTLLGGMPEIHLLDVIAVTNRSPPVDAAEEAGIT
jgi:quinol monooxygenase YgiN